MDRSQYWDALSARLSRRRLLVRAGIGAIGVVGLAGCTSNSAPASPAASPAAAGVTTPASGAPVASPTAAAVRPKQGGTLRVTSGRQTWPHLDPHLTANPSALGFGIGLNWSRLLKFKLKGVPLPAFLPTGDIAESWDQPDDITYVFKLRRNVKWQNIPPANGRPFTADDVLFSYNRQRTKDPAFVNAGLLAAIARLEAPDPYTVKVTVDKPAADFLLSIAAPQSVMVLRELVEQKGDLKEGPLIGTGPFIVEKADPRGTSVARRNPDYFIPGEPHIDEYDLIPLPDSQAIVAAFRADQLDIIPQATFGPRDALDLQKAKPGIGAIDVKGLGSGTDLGFKLDRKPFDDLRVRQALYKAIDAQAVIDTAYYGGGWLSVGLPLPSIEWAIPEAEMKQRYQRDVEGAKRLLAQAGLANGFEFTMAVGTNNDSFQPAAELIQQQWKDIGVQANLRLMDGATFDETVRGRGDFEAYWGAITAQPSADGQLFAKYHSKGTQNITKVNDPRLDQMIEQQTTLVRDPEARKKALLEIQRYILDQAYAHYIHTFDSPCVVQPYVRDYFPGFGALNLEGDRWAQVWLDK